jgi:hypothetical protein
MTSKEPQSSTEAGNDAPVADWYRIAVEDGLRISS